MDKDQSLGDRVDRYEKRYVYRIQVSMTKRNFKCRSVGQIIDF